MTRQTLVLFAATSLVASAAFAQVQLQSSPAPADNNTPQTSGSNQGQTTYKDNRHLQSPQQQQQQTQSTTLDNQTASSTNSGQVSPHADDIRRILARVTEDGFKGNLRQLTDNFVTTSADQFDRSGKKSNLTGPNASATNTNANDVRQLEDQLRQTSKDLQNAWKQKYGHDFNIDRKNEAVVYGGDTFQILKGDMGNQALNQAQTAGAQVGATGAGLDNPGAASNNQNIQGTARVGDTNVSGSANANGTNTNTNTSSNNNHTLSNGARAVGAGLAGGNQTDTAQKMDNRMATVIAQQSHGAPTVSLTLVNEGTFGNRWHIQPAAGLDYRTLASSLNHHLQEVLNMQAQWPQDENEAAKMVSHHILAAIALPPMENQQAGASSQLNNTAQPAGYSSGTQQQQPTQQSQTPRAR